MTPYDLAMLLAASHSVDTHHWPHNKLELINLWNTKTDSVQTAYLRRAKRLLKALDQ